MEFFWWSELKLLCAKMTYSEKKIDRWFIKSRNEGKFLTNFWRYLISMFYVDFIVYNLNGHDWRINDTMTVHTMLTANKSVNFQHHLYDSMQWNFTKTVNDAMFKKYFFFFLELNPWFTYSSTFGKKEIIASGLEPCATDPNKYSHVNYKHSNNTLI